MPSFFAVSSAMRSTSVAGVSFIHAEKYPRRRPSVPASALKLSPLGTLAVSPASGPLMALSTRIVSSTLRAIGPSLSRDQQSVMAPVRGTRLYVGRRPVTPQRMKGLTFAPPVSEPIANATRPAAVDAPGPALDPDAPSSSNHGFIVWPPNQMSL